MRKELLKVIASVMRAVGAAAFALFVLSFGPLGCGALSALGNPKALMASQDGSPISVVVRRSDSAEKTSQEIDRLLVETAVNDESEWLDKVALTAERGKELIEAAKKKAVYDLAPQAKVLPVEAWVKAFSEIKSEEKDHPNLLALINEALAEKYTKVLEKKKELAKIKGEKVAAEKKLDDEKISAGDKAKVEAEVVKLDEQITKTAAEVDPLVDAFLASVKEGASKTKAEVRDRVGKAVVPMLTAIDDAKVANGAAVIRYPFALPGVKDDLSNVVKAIVADVVEEATGKMPNMKTLVPEVGLDGTDVTVKLAGLSPEEMGKLEMGKIVDESVSRSGTFVKKTVVLLGTASATQDLLNFQADVLEAVKAGFSASGWAAPAAVAIAEIPGSAAPEKK